MAKQLPAGYHECTFDRVEFEVRIMTTWQAMVQAVEVMGRGTKDCKVITCMNCGMNSYNISMMARWKVVGAVFKPNIMTTATYTPQSVTKAVLS